MFLASEGQQSLEAKLTSPEVGTPCPVLNPSDPEGSCLRFRQRPGGLLRSRGKGSEGSGWPGPEKGPPPGGAWSCAQSRAWRGWNCLQEWLPLTAP